MINFNRRRRGNGQTYIEFVLTLPILIVLLSIIIDFGRYVSVKQELISLTREGASLAMRQMDSPSTTTFSNTMNQIISNAVPANMNADGRIYIGRVFYDGVNPAKIVQYQQQGAQTQPAKILTAGLNGNANIGGNVILQSNQTCYVVEIYRKFTPLMPVSGPILFDLMKVNGTNRLAYLYDVAFF